MSSEKVFIVTDMRGLRRLVTYIDSYPDGDQGAALQQVTYAGYHNGRYLYRIDMMPLTNDKSFNVRLRRLTEEIRIEPV